VLLMMSQNVVHKEKSCDWPQPITK
jgi:hypothetical protein